MERKEIRPGIVRVPLDVPTPLYLRLKAYCDDLEQQLGGVNAMGIIRGMVDRELTRLGYPPRDQRTEAKTARPSKR